VVIEGTTSDRFGAHSCGLITRTKRSMRPPEEPWTKASTSAPLS